MTARAAASRLCTPGRADWCWRSRPDENRWIDASLGLILAKLEKPRHLGASRTGPGGANAYR
eukprot:CAMPEP_0167800858 /NCGR_PEP_ID=MMETSP0111_2-20121227/18039_1 /TAXON_ID=91324 /ORGANISM="Lotharella globosa, Strain CCCM811" /LENGTH=61 /DNA_ID=CAMNT_0007696313 /DNA_START=365 /DNA_END=547 /DNA_ORIENTATION=-